MITETRRPLTSWECYTPEMVFLNCGSCADKFAADYKIELSTGRHPYGEGEEEGPSVSECWACHHETDYPLSCDGCGQYLAGHLTPDGVQYLKEGNFPKWLRDYYLSTK